MMHHRRTRQLAWITLVVSLLVACGVQPVSLTEIVVYPGAEAVGLEPEGMAELLVDALRQAAGGEGVTAEIALYSAPEDATWEKIGTWYGERMEETGWAVERELDTEVDILRTIGWSRGSGANEQALVVGLLQDPLGDGSLLVLGLFSQQR